MSPKQMQLALTRARALSELQLQQPIRLQNGRKFLGFALPVEFLTEAGWKKLVRFKPVLLLSVARAEVLGLRHPRGVAALDAAGLSLAALMQWAAGAKRGLAPAARLGSPPFGTALAALAKQAGIIPAMLFFPDARAFPDAFAVDVKALAFIPPVELIRGETVSLPLPGAEDATLTSFRTHFGAAVHLVLTMGRIDSKTPPLVRVHSSCVTGDLLGSLRCDCGNQLQLALAQMKKSAAGVLIYLHQEGRGIGISSKLRAYALQERGIDTFDANRQLGFAEDERDFSLAAGILKALGLRKIRLLTNNPGKLEAFVESDITVSERLPLITDHNAHNHAYLAAKGKKAGHLF